MTRLHVDHHEQGEGIYTPSPSPPKTHILTIAIPLATINHLHSQAYTVTTNFHTQTTMTSVANRPGTPFPSTSSLSHASSSKQGYFAQPLHFHMAAMPTPTPPSLLKRSSSNGSAASVSRSNSLRRSAAVPAAPANTPLSPATPPLVARRTSCASTMSSVSSPAMPETPLEPMLELPALYSHPNKPIEDEYTRSQSFEPTTPVDNYRASVFTYHEPPRAEPSKPVRPPLKRRDTPRPTPTAVSPFSSFELDRELELQRTYTSFVDGGKWVVV